MRFKNISPRKNQSHQVFFAHYKKWDFLHIIKSGSAIYIILQSFNTGSSLSIQMIG